MNSGCLQRLYSTGRHGRDEALLVASMVGGCNSQARLMKHPPLHVEEAASTVKGNRVGHLSVSGKPTPAKRRRSECGKEAEWAMDADLRPGTKRVHNASKENTGVPSLPVEPPPCTDAILMDGIGPDFMKLAMGLVLPLNLEQVPMPRARRKLSEHERQANARRLLDEELAKRLQLAVTTDTQLACAYQPTSNKDQPASTRTQSTSPSDLADAAFITSREFQTRSCGSSKMQ